MTHSWESLVIKRLWDKMFNTDVYLHVLKMTELGNEHIVQISAVSMLLAGRDQDTSTPANVLCHRLRSDRPHLSLPSSFTSSKLS